MEHTIASDLPSQLPLLILLLPFVGFLINGVVYPLAFRGFGKTGPNLAGVTASVFIGAAFCLAVASWSSMHSTGQALIANPFTWYSFGGLHIPFELRLDQLNMIPVFLITGIGSLIHIYSIGYMHDEPCVGRFFSYLNLFCFAMLLLVLGNNLPLLFFGWEGVGLCSYLLIGFWYTDTEKANHGKKAFVVNRIGDLGFLIGMFLLYKTIGTVNFTEIAGIANSAEGQIILAPVVTAICLFLFIGATGKSAQIPLYVWLPDAMSGPTPVSALIHAATMVTAGVYLIARLNPLFSLSPEALSVVANVGAFTALFAGTIAIAQTDIKKVLAYSTVSQLGYMFLACGVGAYQTAVFHLMTHAFFKALLFLGSGSVIHACSGEQDMRKMGGLKAHLPHTHITMLVGSLAISGIPFFSGFFSKDEILYSTIALPFGQSHLFFVGMITAVLTAVYTGRMMAMTFYGKERLDHHAKEHLHESPAVMTGPLYVLAILAAFGGFFGVPHILGDIFGHLPHFLNHWLEPIATAPELPLVGIHLPLHEGLAMALSGVLAILAFVTGVVLFKTRFFISDLFSGLAFVQKILSNKFYIDELYEFLIVAPTQAVANFSGKIIDKIFIDGSVNGIGRGVRLLGSGLKALQTGDLQSYATVMIVGLLVAIFSFIKILA